MFYRDPYSTTNRFIELKEESHYWVIIEHKEGVRRTFFLFGKESGVSLPTIQYIARLCAYEKGGRKSLEETYTELDRGEKGDPESFLIAS